MPDGYLVNLGADQLLTVADSITGPFTAFTDAQSLGAGEWTFTGTIGTTSFFNETETGEYFLATDGNVYFVPDLGPLTSLSFAQTATTPPHDPINIVEGTGGDDLINGGYNDAQGDSVNDSADNADLVYGYGGNDDLRSRSGDDTVFGGAGNDTLRGGSGDDELHGDGQTSETESLNWLSEGADGTALDAGFTQNTGQIDVTVSFANDGDNNPDFDVESTDTEYVMSGEDFATNSSLRLFGNGDAATSTTTIDFAAASTGEVQDEVQNVTFRINDIDAFGGNHRDVVTVNAIDGNGNPVTVTLTASGDDVVSGNTVTAGNALDNPEDANGSVLVEIAGPVSQIQIIYSNADNGTQAINVTDVFFDTIPIADGDDVIRAGSGQDTLFGGGGDDNLVGGGDEDSISGGAGNDTISAAEGDTVSGGDGDDLFLLVSHNEGGTADITIVGGEGDEADGDTLDLNGQANISTLNYTVNEAGEKAGTVELLDGSLVSFTNIEHIICFTPGTLIQTAQGPRAIEQLQAGDLIVTRDNGLQPLRWIGQRTVPGIGRFAPVELHPALMNGTGSPLLVSPQHRLLWSGAQAQMLFGEAEVLVAAQHLLDHPAARRIEQAQVTYIHLMLDRHEVLFANGVATESFYPGDTGLAALDDRSRHEMFELFPDLRSHTGAFGDTARICLKAHEARLLAA